MLIVWHLSPLSSLRGVLFHHCSELERLDPASDLPRRPRSASDRSAPSSFAKRNKHHANRRRAGRAPDQERGYQARIAEVCAVEQRIAKSGPTQIRLTEIGPGEHGGIKLSAAHVSFTQAGAPAAPRWPSARTPCPPWRDRHSQGLPKRGFAPLRRAPDRSARSEARLL